MTSLADLAMGDDGGAEKDDDSSESGGEAVFSDAATQAFELWGEGKRKEAVASLKGAIEACVADYMSDE